MQAGVMLGAGSLRPTVLPARPANRPRSCAMRSYFLVDQSTRVVCRDRLVPEECLLPPLHPHRAGSKTFCERKASVPRIQFYSLCHRRKTSWNPFQQFNKRTKMPQREQQQQKQQKQQQHKQQQRQQQQQQQQQTRPSPCYRNSPYSNHTTSKKQRKKSVVNTTLNWRSSRFD